MLDEIAEFLPIKPLSLVDLTAQAAKSEESIGLLASPTTIKSKLFHNALPNVKVNCLNPDGQRKTEQIIRSVIAGRGDEQLAALQKQIAQLAKSNPRIILGCTELSVLADGLNDRRLIDTVNLAVERICRDETKL